MKIGGSHFYKDDVALLKVAFGSLSYCENPTEADFIYLSGGADVDPKRYDGDSSLCMNGRTPLDEWDEEWLPKLIDINKPIFGLCRGSQTLWVALGGKLREHIFPPQGMHPTIGSHSVVGLWGCSNVNSFHHQAADDREDSPLDTEVTLRSVPDRAVEAWVCRNNILGVQWHPEMLDDSTMISFAALLNAVAKKCINNIWTWTYKGGATWIDSPTTL